MPPIELTNSAKIALAISAAFPLGAGAAPAGRIDFAVGNVTAKLADGSTRPLAKGADINAGETIDTGEGRAQLRYTDGSQVSLRPGTQYRIDDYKFSGKNDGEEKAFFSLLKGGFRTITGLIGKGNREAYKVTTPTATIGIRGTEFAVLSDQNGVTISTGDGLVQVCNAGGCIVLASGESAVVADKDGKPVRVINKGPDSTSDKPSTPSVVVEKPKEDSVIAASLPSAPGYAMGIVGMATYDNGETVTAPFMDKRSSVTATFSNGTNLTTASIDGGEAGTRSYTSSSVSGFTDGMIGWGRWTSGSDSTNLANIGYGGNALTNAHYIIGQPTTAAYMEALHDNNVTGTYVLVGYTVPTSEYGVVHSGTLTGSLTANFGSNQVAWSLNGFNFGASNFSGSVSGNADITGSTFSSSSMSSVHTTGLFVGANAARAGLVYKFNPGTGSQGTIMGAAAFKK